MTSLADPDICRICGEPLTSLDEIAEMHDAEMLNDPEMYGETKSGVVHAECGLRAGWVVS